MDKATLKTIETHLAKTAQSNLADLVAQLRAQGKLTPQHMVALEKMAAQSQNQEGGQNAAANQAEKPEGKFGDVQTNSVVREADAGKTFEKLMHQGQKKGGAESEQKLLDFLSEIEGGEPTNKNMAMNNPAPPPSTEFDEKFFEEFNEELEFDEEHASDGGADDDDDDDDDETAIDPSESEVCVKDILLKI